MVERIMIIKKVNSYNKPEVGKVYEVIGFGITRWGTELRYIIVDGELVGIRNKECMIVDSKTQ